jgi:hypothetical protein
MLTHIISLDLQFPTCIFIQNQCSNTELVSPVYFGDGVVCPKLFDQRLDIGTKMTTSFAINATQDEFEGTLLYKLKRHVKSDGQCNTSTSTTEANKNETVHVHMLVTWKMKDAKPLVRAILLEHTEEFIWNESRLVELYNKNHSRTKEYADAISFTWLMDDNVVLKTTFILRSLKGKPELSISISEEEKDEYAMKPLCVDLER